MASSDGITRVLFLCLGNICRSPLAEGIFQHQVGQRGLQAYYQAESAGTGGWHAGELPDPRSQAIANAHGPELTSRARQIHPRDLRQNDYIVCMDSMNRSHVQRMLSSRPQQEVNVVLMRDYDPNGPGDVPDPYQDEEGAFQYVYELLTRSIAGLLDALEAERARS